MKTITLVGTGPRGMSVLERMLMRINQEARIEKVKIIVVDEHCLGQGRVWDSRQSKNYLMNTLSTEISAFSGSGDITDARPGAGPSFSEWWKNTKEDFDIYQGYAPRSYYGEYLYFVWQVIVDNIPEQVNFVTKTLRVIDLKQEENAYRITDVEGENWLSDAAIIATGHSVNHYPSAFQEIENLPLQTTGVKFFRGDAACEMALDTISAGESVGVLGLGLSFFDVISELTEGRGGRFIQDCDNKLIYYPSGHEPKLYCGSRGGLPIFARGRNQKPASFKHQSIILTSQVAQELRENKKDNVDFEIDVWPLLEAEVNFSWMRQTIANLQGEGDAEKFSALVKEGGIKDSASLAFFASELLSTEITPLNLKHLAQPFKGLTFADENHWHDTLLTLLRADTAEAEKGNIRSPLKGALDVLRNVRDQVRILVDFAGLTPNSHRKFIEEYVPIITLLSAGPPFFRLKQLEALISGGIVSIVPPDIQLSARATGYQLAAGSMPSYSRRVTSIIDARIPTACLQLDKNPLTASLYQRGIFTPFINSGSGVESFETGGVNVTRAPFHPIDRQGKVHTRLFVLGIPTEHTRWFMQSGSSRPSHWIDFMIDADAIAEAALNI